MKTALDCLPCFLRQSIFALDLGSKDEAVKRRILSRLLPIVRDTDYDQPPAYTTTFLHRVIREELGSDPFADIKKKYNAIALGLMDELRARIRAASDSLWMAARLAIAGNIIDFGIFRDIDLDETIERAVTDPLHVDDLDVLRRYLDESDDVLYLLDNAGEIVFDRLLIEELAAAGKRVTAVVRGEPVLNDVTREDALQVGLDRICAVMDNGCDGIGTILSWCSTEFVEAFRTTSLVIAKGQANFETLARENRRAIFLLQAKCQVLASAVNVPLGAMLLMADSSRSGRRD